MDKKPKTLTEAYQRVYEPVPSEARLDKLARLHKLGKTMSDAESAYVVIHDMLYGSDVNKEDYIAVGRELKDGGMKRDEYSLETLQKALEYAKQDGWEFEISPILDQLGGPAGYKQDYEREEHQDNEHQGWPGDGTGTDDLADYNEREADDYYNESKSLNEAYEEVSFFKDKPEPPKDERQKSMSHVLKMSYDLNDIGSRLSSIYRSLIKNESVDQEIKNALAKDGEMLVAMSSEIEDIYNKYLSV